MNKIMISTFVVAVCLMISAVRAQECSLVLRRCSEGCCFIPPLALRGTCTTGLEGEQCGGINMCGCMDGFECKDKKCVAQSTTAQPTTPSAETPAPEVPAETSAPEVPAETTPPAQTTVAPPSTEAPEITP